MANMSCLLAKRHQGSVGPSMLPRTDAGISVQCIKCNILSEGSTPRMSRTSVCIVTCTDSRNAVLQTCNPKAIRSETFVCWRRETTNGCRLQASPVSRNGWSCCAALKTHSDAKPAKKQREVCAKLAKCRFAINAPIASCCAARSKFP